MTTLSILRQNFPVCCTGAWGQDRPPIPLPKYLHSRDFTYFFSLNHLFMAYLYNLKYSINAKNYPKQTFWKKIQIHKEQDLEKKLCYVSPCMSRLFTKIHLSRDWLLIYISERCIWFSNFTIFDRKYVLKFFGKIKTFLKLQWDRNS